MPRASSFCSSSAVQSCAPPSWHTALAYTHLFAPTHAPPSTGVSTVSSHTALLPSALESHPSSTHVASQHAPCTLGCGLGTVPTSVGVGLGCDVTSSPSLGRGGVARLPAGRPVHACTSAQHRMHAAVEVAASMHKKAVRALLLVARETHPGNEGGTSFAAGRARPQVLAVARVARSAPRWRQGLQRVIPLDMCTREESEDDDDRVSLLDAGRANTQHRNMAKMRITIYEVQR